MKQQVTQNSDHGKKTFKSDIKRISLKIPKILSSTKDLIQVTNCNYFSRATSILVVTQKIKKKKRNCHFLVTTIISSVTAKRCKYPFSRMKCPFIRLIARKNAFAWQTRDIVGSFRL